MTEYRRQFGSIVHMYQACMHVGKRSALVRSKYIIFKKERKSVCKLLHMRNINIIKIHIF